MIMADFAETLVIEAPERHGTDRLAATPMWRQGKRILPLDTKDAEQRKVLEEPSQGQMSVSLIGALVLSARFRL